MINNINPVKEENLVFNPYLKELSYMLSPISRFPVQPDNTAAYDLKIGNVYYCQFRDCEKPALRFLGYAFKESHRDSCCSLYYMFKDAYGTPYSVKDFNANHIFENREDYVEFMKTGNAENALERTGDIMDIIRDFPLRMDGKGRILCYQWDAKSCNVVTIPIKPVGIWVDKNGNHVEFKKEDLENETLYFDRNECVESNLEINDDFGEFKEKDDDDADIAYIIKGKQKDIMELLTHTKGNIKISGVEE